MAKIETGKHVESYLKKNIPNYNPQKILVMPKSQAGIWIIRDGKFFSITGEAHGWYTPSDYETNVTKLEEYFETGEWDNKVYFKLSGTPPLDLQDYIIVAKKSMMPTLKKLRDAGYDVGGQEVDKGKDKMVWVKEDQINP